MLCEMRLLILRIILSLGKLGRTGQVLLATGCCVIIHLLLPLPAENVAVIEPKVVFGIHKQLCHRG